jgi:hypothetical protein
MTAYRVIAVPQDLADEVRTTRRSPGYGHPAHADLAAGYGPCRLCLRKLAVGHDRRILFTHDPFVGLEPRPLPGPVYLHEQACTRFPQDAGFPEDLRDLPLTFNAYGTGRRLREQAYVADGRVEATVQALLDRADVDYVHVRNTEAGCYLFRIERAA